ncbi:anti-sigma factor RsbA family regulatory protein [Actinomadura namibiensis]|uniref:Anti-sigma regulatory factor (Ser/Thr protein kinase) n=1 Tax=Actinomadura namibiensis TaxID=182080 RepID=A0A7W3LU32_ACTNM|nr:sensor histidine kinase [Actinomadura namibiensis]MBA8954279.1 anti-sigma regulatory factor (Ser/Thr protein kinase) [Actinomadura namibiensis]
MSGSPDRSRDGPRGPCTHQTLPYTSQTRLLSAARPYVEEGLARGETVVVVAADAFLGRLRDLLPEEITDGAGPERIRLVPADAWYTHPARTLTTVHDMVAQARDDGERMRFWGELPWARWSVPQARQWLRYETLLNVMLAGQHVTLCCPVDLARLRPSVLEGVYAAHPYLVESRRRANPRYQSPERLLRRLNRTRLPDPPADVRRIDFDHRDLAEVRRSVAATARSAGLPDDRVFPVVLAVAELAANAVVHVDGPGRLEVWSSPGELVYQIRSTGTAPMPPACGFLPPDPLSTTGRGLWMARQLADVLEVGICDGDGRGRADGGDTAVRAHFALPRRTRAWEPDARA